MLSYTALIVAALSSLVAAQSCDASNCLVGSRCASTPPYTCENDFGTSSTKYAVPIPTEGESTMAGPASTLYFTPFSLRPPPATFASGPNPPELTASLTQPSAQPVPISATVSTTAAATTEGVITTGAPSSAAGTASAPASKASENTVSANRASGSATTSASQVISSAGASLGRVNVPVEVVAGVMGLCAIVFGA